MGGDVIIGGDGMFKAKSSKVIGERVSVMSIGSFSCVGGGGGTLRGGELGEFNLEAMDEEDVALVDGVLDGAFGALGDESWCFGEGVLSSS
ncbi:hypothetical protein Tco_1220774 [Tanacetum coccineum]